MHWQHLDAPVDPRARPMPGKNAFVTLCGHVEEGLRWRKGVRRRRRLTGGRPTPGPPFSPTPTRPTPALAPAPAPAFSITSALPVGGGVDPSTQ